MLLYSIICVFELHSLDSRCLGTYNRYVHSIGFKTVNIYFFFLRALITISIQRNLFLLFSLLTHIQWVLLAQSANVLYSFKRRYRLLDLVLIDKLQSFFQNKQKCTTEHIIPNIFSIVINFLFRFIFVTYRIT